MKRILLVSIGTILASVCASAGNYFGVTGGYNLSNYYSPSYEGRPNYEARSGFDLGVAYEHRFNARENGNNWYLDAGLRYSLQRYRCYYFMSDHKSSYSGSDLVACGPQEFDVVEKFTTLKLPVGVGYNFKLNEKLGLGPKAYGTFVYEVGDYHGLYCGFGGGAKLNIGERISIEAGYDVTRKLSFDYYFGAAYANFTYYFLAK